MLLDLRENQNSYIIKVIFFITVTAMVFSSVFSAFSGNSNPILLKSSVGQIRRKDLFTRSQPWSLIFQQLQQKDPQDVPLALNQYLLPKIYQDFFSHHGFKMSDRLAWSLFLKRFQNEQMTSEKIQALNHAIQNQYGSKTQFLSQLKVQLYTVALQEALYAISQPLHVPFDIQQQADKLERHAHVYTYLPEHFQQQLPAPSMQDLQSFYEQHLEHYVESSSVDVDYFLFTPAQVALPEVGSDEYAILSQELEQRGYTDINAALIQQSLYHKILDDLNAQVSFTSFDDLKQFLQSKGVMHDQLSSQSLNNLHEDDLDDLFEQPGLYNVAQSVYTNHQQSLQHYSLSEEQELFLFVKSQHEGGAPAFDVVQHRVLLDWKRNESYQLALAHAQQDYNNYCNTADLKAMTANNHKEIYVADIFGDQRLSNEIKVSLATLFDPRLGVEKSAQVLQADDRDHISVVVLQELRVQQDTAVHESQSQQMTFNLDNFAQKELMHKVVDADLYKQFGYQIVNPEFWTFVQRS